PLTAMDTFVRGDTIGKSAPSTGDPAGWVNVSTSSTPLWRPFGKLGTGAKKLTGNHTADIDKDYDIGVPNLYLSDDGNLYNGVSSGINSTRLSVFRNPIGGSLITDNTAQIGALQIKLPQLSRLSTVHFKGTVHTTTRSFSFEIF